MNSGRRSYQQHCGLARALDVVGERWTLLMVRELLLGPRRYADFLEHLPGITTNLLAKRLREMHAVGLIEKVKLAPKGAGQAYALTEAGRALEPAVMEMARWGGRLLEAPRAEDRRDLGWALLSMKRRYPGGADFVAELTAGERSFELVFGPAALGVQEKRSDGAAVRASGRDEDIFFDVFFRGVPSEKLEAAGALRIEGDRRLWGAIVTSFRPPLPVGPDSAR